MRLPDFIVLGGHKCGSTSLHYYLRQHPQIYLPKRKGADFLNKPDRIFTIDKYAEFFDAAERDQARGEVSSIYLYQKPRVLDRITQYMPKIKLITILRNPVERLYSNYLHLGMSAGKTFEQFMQEPKSLELGFYCKFVKDYYATFNKNQIKVYIFEEFFKDIASSMRDLFKFIGVDDSFTPHTNVVLRKGGADVRKPGKYRLLRRSKIIRSLLAKILRPFTSKQQRFNLLIKSDNLFSPKKPKLSQEARKGLIKKYKEDILSLQTLIKTFPTGLNRIKNEP